MTVKFYVYYYLFLFLNFVCHQNGNLSYKENIFVSSVPVIWLPLTVFVSLLFEF